MIKFKEGIELTILINYSEQHVCIINLVRRLFSFLESSDIENNIKEIHTLLINLYSFLKAHFSGEYEFIYPKLIATGSLEACDLAGVHFIESVKLMIEFRIQFEKWMSCKINKDNVRMFKNEISVTLNRLIYKIFMEDRELYPLLLSFMN